jgi:hypothetical protein
MNATHSAAVNIKTGPAGSLLRGLADRGPRRTTGTDLRMPLREAAANRVADVSDLPTTGDLAESAP